MLKSSHEVTCVSEHLKVAVTQMGETLTPGAGEGP